MAKVFTVAMACLGVVLADSKWVPICWTDATEKHQELLGTDTCPAVLNKHGSDEYNWRKDAGDDSTNLAPTMASLSCDVEGPNAEMSAFWKERHNSEWTEEGRGEVEKFAKQWGDSRQQVEKCLADIKSNPADKTCLEGINMLATFGHCLKRPEKQACGECGLMRIKRDQPLVLTSKATFPAPDHDFHILVMCVDVATWSYEIDQDDFLFANHKLRTMANGDTDPHALITDIVPASCLTGEELTTTVTDTTTTTGAGTTSTTIPIQFTATTTVTTTTTMVAAASTTTTTAKPMSTSTATAATRTTTATGMTTSSAAEASTTVMVTTTVVQGVIQCASLKAHISDEWCNANCKSVTPFCPSQLCQCSGAATTTNTGSTTAHDVTTTVVDTTSALPTTTRTVLRSTTVTSAPSTTHQDSATTTAGGPVKCQAVTSQATDGWCTTNCNHSTPFCPPQLCRCSSGSSRRLRGR